MRERNRFCQRGFKPHHVTIGGQQRLGPWPAVDAYFAVEHHCRPGKDKQIVPRKMQIADAQPIELQKMLAHQNAALVERHQPQGFIALFFVDVHGDFEHRRPAAQYRPAQPEEHAFAINRETFNIKTIVLARYREVRRKVRILCDHMGEQVACAVALQALRAPPILCHAHQTGLAGFIVLNRQTRQQATVSIERNFCEAFGVIRVAAIQLCVLAFQPVRAHHPQIAIGNGHAL